MKIISILQSQKAAQLQTLLAGLQGQACCPIDLGGQACLSVDLSRHNAALAQWPAQPAEGLLHGYIETQKAVLAAPYLWGGYAEDRDFYKLSPNFHTEGAPRSIHLGIDIWAPAGTPVRAALHGTVHSTRNNAGFGNYGGTIVLRHEFEGIEFFTLYGHLATATLHQWPTGTAVAAGQPIAALGAPEENGGWAPHLHFQVMADMLGLHGDFPGVAARAEQDFYLALCPNPNLLLAL